jgi:phospholipase C
MGIFDQPLSRRSLLSAGAVVVAGATMATKCSSLNGSGNGPSGVPFRLNPPGTLPFPDRPEGEQSLPEIEHIVVVMMENHTFDNVLGMLPHEVRSRHQVDGLPVTGSGRQLASNPDAQGQPVFMSHSATVCPPGGISQSWTASHIAWDGGRNDGFVKASSAEAMTFFEQSDLPFIYSVASTFPIGQRYFSSVLAQTYPNRRFLFSGTASGTIATDSTTFSIPAANGTIFDRLDQFGISWKDYYSDEPSPLIIPGVASTPSRLAKFVNINQYFTDAAAGQLPAVSYVEPNYSIQSEENPQDVQFGDQFLEQVVTALINSPNWENSALIINYDEGGGYFDHVPPPPAVKPDNIAPLLAPGDPPGGYDRYGFRVPLVVVSPYGRPDYVSSVVQDHTSVLRFIERNWNLGAITYRDANAADMTDYFDFTYPALLHPPALAAAAPIGPGLAVCEAAGQNPPQPAASSSGS